MKKTLSLIIASLMMIVFFNSCSDSKQAKTDTVKTAATDPKVKSGTSGDSLLIDEINRQVRGFSIDGFPGGSAKLSGNKDLDNMKNIVGLLVPIIDRIPDGYVMQITGHCADYESVLEQKRVSTARAAKVYNELKQAGVSSKKISYKGVGINEPVEGYPDKGREQRSVSFKALKK